MKTMLNKLRFIALVALKCALFSALSARADEVGATNASGHAVALTGTNQPRNALEDAEAAEIRRLGDMSMTNLAAGQQYGKLVNQRHARYLKELRETADPVSVAVRMALDPYSAREEGIKELAKHWEDPRSEQTLEAISLRGPHMMGELGRTFEGKAYHHLMELRSRKQLNQIVGGKKSEQERINAIIEFLQGRPDLVTPYPEPVEKAVLAQIVFQELAESNDTNAVRMVLKSGQFRREYAEKHRPEMLAYAQELTGEEAVSNPRLVECLYESGDKAVIRLFEKWLPHAKTEGGKSYLQSALRELRKADKN